MLAKANAALAQLLTHVPYSGFNIERRTDHIPRGIIVDTHSTSENKKYPNSNYFILPTSERNALYNRYRTTLPLLIEDSNISSQHFAFWINDGAKELIDFSWVYAFIVKMKTADCALLSKALCWLLLAKFDISKRVEIVTLTSHNTMAIFHAFIIINRATKSIMNRPETWGDQAIVIDPWHKILFTANKWNTFKEYLPITNNSLFRGTDPTYYSSYFDSLKLSKTWRSVQTSHPQRIRIKEIYDPEIMASHKMPYQLRC